MALVNVTLGSGKAVHIAETFEDFRPTPECGGNRAGERYNVTTREVTCKRCLKWMVKREEAAEPVETEIQAPVATVAEPATQVESATPVESVGVDKATGWPVFRIGSKYYTVGPRSVGTQFGHADRVPYFRSDDKRHNKPHWAYADSFRGTTNREIWDARRAYDA